MLTPFLDDPLFGGIPGPGLTGSHGLTDITFAGQRHVMPLSGSVEKTTGPDGISQREEQEMGWLSRDEHHETPCDKSGTWWAKPNPMGWGSNGPRVVKRADANAQSQNNRTTDHGSKAGKALMSGRGALIRWSGDHVQVSGEKPKGRKR